MKVFIDPGHGGSDSGAAANGILEKDINITTALKVRELLERCGIDVEISRETDVYVDLNERCRMANEWGADYFISIHHNAGGGKGYEIIHSISGGLGQQLANSIATAFDDVGQAPHGDGLYSRQGQNGDYYCVIRETSMSAIITEYAFIDTDDVTHIDSTEELYTEAEAIVKGFCNHVGIKYVDDTPAQAPDTQPESQVEDWKYQGINELYDAGLLSDKDGWLQKVDEPMPVWAVTIILSNLYKKLKGGE